jgi:hypothetical protein
MKAFSSFAASSMFKNPVTLDAFVLIGFAIDRGTEPNAA